MGVTAMTKSKAARAHELAEWFREQAESGSPQADLMARAALALECVASGRSLANDNAPAKLRAYR
jgi:hypothetical protein